MVDYFHINGLDSLAALVIRHRDQIGAGSQAGNRGLRAWAGNIVGSLSARPGEVIGASTPAGSHGGRTVIQFIAGLRGDAADHQGQRGWVCYLEGSHCSGTGGKSSGATASVSDRHGISSCRQTCGRGGADAHLGESVAPGKGEWAGIPGDGGLRRAVIAARAAHLLQD